LLANESYLVNRILVTNYHNSTVNSSKENTSTNTAFLSLNVLVGVYIRSKDFFFYK